MTKNVTYRPTFQGDLCIRRIKALPADATALPSASNHHVLAHSETGHHHVIDAGAATLFIDKMNEFISYLDVATEAEIQHLRGFDTHEPVTLAPGIYEIRRQREYVAEGFRRVED